MSEESSERAWLLEPAGAGQVRIHIEVAEGVELGEEQRSALNALVDAFYEQEVEGYALPDRCRPLTCEPRITNCASDFCGKFSCEVGIMPMTGSIG